MKPSSDLPVSVADTIPNRPWLWRVLPLRAQWGYLGPDSGMEMPILRGGGTLTDWRVGKSRAGPYRKYLSDKQGAAPRKQTTPGPRGLGGKPILLQEHLVLDSSWTGSVGGAQAGMALAALTLHSWGCRAEAPLLQPWPETCSLSLSPPMSWISPWS